MGDDQPSPVNPNPDPSMLSDEALDAALHMRAAQRQANAAAGTHYQQGDTAPWREYDPARDMSGGAQAAAGLGEGVANIYHHTSNLLGHESDQDLADWQHLMEPLTETPAGNLGSFAGESAAVLPATLATEGVPAIAELGAAGKGAIQGGLQGLLSSDPGHRTAGTTFGAVGGMMWPGMKSTAAMLARGLPRTPAAGELIDRGVRLMPGQMNPDSVWNKIEENVRSIPVIGNTVERGRQQAWTDFQRGAIEEAGAPGFKMPNTKGMTVKDMFNAAQQSYGPHFDAAKGFPVTPHIWNPGANVPLKDLFDAAARRAGVGATADVRESARDFLSGQLDAFATKAKAAGGWKSDDLLDLRSAISEEMRSAGADQSGMKYRQLLQAARDNVTQALESQLPPDASATLRAATRNYPKFAIVRDAMKSGGDQVGGFTPSQFSQAVRTATDKGEYAAGGGLMRDWSAPGKEIFTERNPKTGAVLGTLGALAAGGAGAAAVPHLGIPALGAAAGMYTFGRPFMRGTTPLQRYAQAAMDRVGKMTPPLVKEGVDRAGQVGMAQALIRAKRRQGQIDDSQLDQMPGNPAQ